jgi:hypothetical protein
MSYRFPSGLVSAPNHTKIAWVQNEEGKRNIWVIAKIQANSINELDPSRMNIAAANRKNDIEMMIVIY